MLKLNPYRAKERLAISSWIIALTFLPAAVIALAFWFDSNYPLAIFTIPGLVFLIWRWPNLAFVIIPFTFMFLEGLYVSARLIPRQITWLSDAILLVLFARIFLERKIHRMDDGPKIPLILFAAVFVISSLLNNVNVWVTLVAIRNYFKYIILYLVITRLRFSIDDVSKGLHIFFIFVVLQAPLVLFEYFLGLDPDSLAGGFGHGGSTYLVIVCAAAASFFVSKYMHEGRIVNVISLIIILTSLGISEIKFGFFLIPLSIAVVLTLSIWKHIKRGLLISSLFLLSFIMAVTIYNSIHKVNLSEFLSTSKIRDYATEEEERELGSDRLVYLGRVARVETAVSTVSKDWLTALVGLGPGQTAPSFFEGAGGRFSKTILGAASESEFPATLLEMGILGVIISTYIMLWLAVSLLRSYRLLSETNDQALMCGLFGSAIVLIVSIFYSNVLFVNDSSSYLFWLSAAYLSLYSERFGQGSDMRLILRAEGVKEQHSLQ